MRDVGGDDPHHRQHADDEQRGQDPPHPGARRRSRRHARGWAAIAIAVRGRWQRRWHRAGRWRRRVRVTAGRRVATSEATSEAQFGGVRGIGQRALEFPDPVLRVVLRFHQCAPKGPAACAVGGMAAGEQRVVVGLSVSPRRVRGVSENSFRCTPAGVCSLGLHVVWCSKYRCRILGGRVAARCGELQEQIAGAQGREIVAKEVMPERNRARVLWSTSYVAVPVGSVSESTVRRHIEHDGDAVA